MEIFRGDLDLSFEPSNFESSCAAVPDELETSSEGSNCQGDDNMILPTADSYKDYNFDYAASSFNVLNKVAQQNKEDGIFLYITNFEYSNTTACFSPNKNLKLASFSKFTCKFIKISRFSNFIIPFVYL